MQTDGEQTLSLVLFSGTDDRLSAAAILAAGAAVMGGRVNIFLQFWALGAFRTSSIRTSHGVAADADAEEKALFRLAEEKGPHWSDVFRQAKEIGEVKFHACAKSMEMYGITMNDLDPLVDDVEGVAAFTADATGPITFI